MPPAAPTADQVADLLDARVGADGFHIGLVGTAPTSLKRLPETDSGWVFRFHKLNPARVAPAWIAAATEACGTAHIEIEDDPDHAFIWILDAGDLTARAIADLATTLVAEHPELFPATSDRCYHCDASKPDVRLVQDRSSAALICDPCLARFKAETAAETQALNPTEPRALLLLPFAVASGAIGWFGSWFVLERLASFTDDGTVILPNLVLLVPVVGVGALIGWPTGRLFKRSGLFRSALSRGVATALFAAAVVTLGEYLFSLWIVYLVIGGMPFFNTWGLILPLLAECNWETIGLRVVLLLTFAAFTFSFAQPNRTRRRL